jgi:hypothetical protein
VSIDLKTNEWNLLKDQFRALVRDESRDESIEKFFDYEIRRRFGEAISRAAEKAENRHSVNRRSANFASGGTRSRRGALDGRRT